MFRKHTCWTEPDQSIQRWLDFVSPFEKEQYSSPDPMSQTPTLLRNTETRVQIDKS